MNIQSPVPAKISIDAFFAWSEHQEQRYELVDGEIRMSPWVMRGHSTIVSNIAFAVQRRLDRLRYAVHQGDFAIATGEASIRYGDLIVEPRSLAAEERTARHPLLIVEVLSDSTLHLDFGTKKDEYLNLPSVQTYMVVAQRHRQVWIWERAAEGRWPTEPTVTIEGEIPITTLNVAISVDEIYEGLSFD